MPQHAASLKHMTRIEDAVMTARSLVTASLAGDMETLVELAASNNSDPYLSIALAELCSKLVQALPTDSSPQEVWTRTLIESELAQA